MYKILKLKNNIFEKIEVSNRVVEYDELRKAIGGYIEHITFNRRLDEANIDVWCNEEGKLIGLELECLIVDSNSKKIIETIAGPLVFTSRDNYGNSLALSERQIEIIKEVIDTSTVPNVSVMPYR